MEFSQPKTNAPSSDPKPAKKTQPEPQQSFVFGGGGQPPQEPPATAVSSPGPSGLGWTHGYDPKLEGDE